MYLSSVTRPSTPRVPDEADAGRRGRVAANVLALGAVSMVTDVSSEMVVAVLPVYLVVGLSLSPAAYGVLDGVYTGATAVLRLAGGYVADRTQQRKAIAGLGYAISCVAKVGLLLAGRSVGAIGAVIAVDRAGKGLRSAPRDALITLSTPPSRLGRAFGVHRALDSAGAFLGPLVAMAVLWLAAGSFDAVFVASFLIAALGVLVLVLFVRNHRAPLPATHTVAPRAAVALVADRDLRRLVLAASLLGLATIGEGFVYLLLQQRSDLGTVWFPLLAVGSNAAFLLLAAPIGGLADRIGRLPVMLSGYGALAAVYLLLLTPAPWSTGAAGWGLLGLTLALNGSFYAATDGVLMALAGPLVPEGLKTTGLALVQTGQALAYLVSSVLFGAVWASWGATVALAAALAMVAVTVPATWLLTRGAVRR